MTLRANTRVPDPSGSVRLRRIRPTDLPALIRLHQRAYAPRPRHFWLVDSASSPRAQARDDIAEVIPNPRRWGVHADPRGCWGVERNGRLVGAVLSTRSPARAPYITEVMVDPGWQRRGVGHELVVAAVSGLREGRREAVTLDAVVGGPGYRLYQRLGFRVPRAAVAPRTGFWVVGAHALDPL